MSNAGTIKDNKHYMNEMIAFELGQWKLDTWLQL